MVFTITAQSRAGAVSTLDALPVGARVSNALISYIAYLGKILWPLDLAVYYPHHVHAYSEWMGVGAFLLLAGITIVAVVQMSRRPFIAMGWFWFVGMLVPVIGLVQVGGQSMADRYTYLPQIGLCIVLAWLLPARGTLRDSTRTMIAAGAGMTVALLTIASARQVSFWKDSETLFTRTLAVTRDNGLIQASLGNVFYDQGRYSEAVDSFRAAIRSLPGRFEFHINLGNALSGEGKDAEALEHYREAARLKGNSAVARCNLGIALSRLGQSEEGIIQLQEAVRIKPDFLEAHEGLAAILASRGQFLQAEWHRNRAAEISAIRKSAGSPW